MDKRLMNRSHFKILLAIGLMLLAGISCRPSLKSNLPVVQLKIDNKVIEVEVAFRTFSRTAGLMFRREMGRDNGMLFVFPDTAPRAFWMKNTVLPLSIAFIDEKGTILNILEMPPETEDTFLSKGPAKFALEMNTGWYDNNHVKAGDLVEGVLTAPKAED